jgi:mono/diheme cytochrome c family protein
MKRTVLTLPLLLALACGKSEATADAPAAASKPTVGQSSAATPSAAQLAKGQQIYASRCAFCHGETGEGDTPISSGFPAANLADGKWVHGGTPDEIATTIARGVPDTPMQGFSEMMMASDIEAVTAYIRTLKPTK